MLSGHIEARTPVRVPSYRQESRVEYTTANGLPSNDVRSVQINTSGRVVAITEKGAAVWTGDRWSIESTGTLIAAKKDAALARLIPNAASVRHQVTASDGRIAVAAESGLYLKVNGTWQTLTPQDGRRSWSLRDARAVAFDAKGRLWAASPQGASVLDNGKWTLYEGADGLPYDDFTSMAAAPDGSVWFGTHRGAIRFDNTGWHYRQGRLWLPGDDVRAITVAADGDVWVATNAGISRIRFTSMSLAEKARFFEEEIDKRHRRTPYGYVLEVSLNRKGDLSQWTQHDSDNDGLWTSMYGAGECYAYAATHSAEARKRAIAAFDALRFLGTVAQGGEHPAPKGFVARSILPTSGPDPNVHDSPEHDRQMRATRDHSWKQLAPRWPRSADGKWYWKTDTSSDELDGHYFFYGLYYDLVAQPGPEREALQAHVKALTDHLVEHNFQLVDHDGKPTRWSVFNPENLNHNRNWWEERGLNSLSILTYLKVTEHVTGDPKYGRIAKELIEKHGYGMNVMIQKTHLGMAGGNQSDDEMYFMNFYHLVAYEKDPDLRQKYMQSFYRHWQNEQPERSALFNFMYACRGEGQTFDDAFGAHDLSPQGDWLQDSVDMLERVPMERINWGHANSHRRDLRLLPAALNEPGEAPRGYRVDGKVIPIDETFTNHWNYDPWDFDSHGDGGSVADGAFFLLPYYMGLYHQFIQE